MDLYKILNVPQDASQDDIKKAYRKIALKAHPDKRKGGSEEFRNATEAYSTLKNPETRKAYDAIITPPQHIKHQGSDLSVTLKVKIEDFINGAERVIRVTRKGLCLACVATGSTEKKSSLCPACGGSGYDSISIILGPKKRCRKCSGYGTIPDGDRCRICSGTGLVDETLQHNIKLNPLRDIVIKGSGNYLTPNGFPGNLIVELNQAKDRLYSRHGLDLKRLIQISPARAVLGGKIPINVFGCNIELAIPSGSQNGAEIEIKDAGIFYENRQGNLSIKIEVLTPNIVTKEEHDLYNKLLSLEDVSWQTVQKLPL
jgi:molecular chaperone DnaJ